MPLIQSLVLFTSRVVSASTCNLEQLVLHSQEPSSYRTLYSLNISTYTPQNGCAGWSLSVEIEPPPPSVGPVSTTE